MEKTPPPPPSSRLFLFRLKRLGSCLRLSISDLYLSFCTSLPSETCQKDNISLISGIIYQCHHVETVFLTEQHSFALTGRNSPYCKILKCSSFSRQWHKTSATRYAEISYSPSSASMRFCPKIIEYSSRYSLTKNGLLFMEARNIIKIIFTFQDFSSISLKGHLQTRKKGPDTMAQMHCVTVTSKQYVGCKSHSRSRKFAHFKRNNPAAKTSRPSLSHYS